jgi:XTP/dITP diphosphohydrolase
MNTRAQQLEAVGRLLDIMDELRAQCPWDRKQTFESLRHLTIEETYELGDAILDGNLEEIKKELGDLLLHIVFYAKLGTEEKAFDLGDIAASISEKLIFRHPHIYGDVQVSSAEEVQQNWEALKLREGKESVLEGVPKGLPAIVKAQRIQDKAAGVGFDWEHKKDVWDKVEEEMQELQTAIAQQNKSEIENELGDVFFALINYARFENVSPESALERTNKKFIQRFQYIEKQALKQGKKLQSMTIEELETLWQEAKN